MSQTTIPVLKSVRLSDLSTYKPICKVGVR